MVILPEQTLESATVVAERLRRMVEELAISHEAKTPPGVVTISVGLAALSPGEKRSFEELIKEADAALYKAKEAGRNTAVVYKLQPKSSRILDSAGALRGLLHVPAPGSRSRTSDWSARVLYARGRPARPGRKA